MKKIKLIFTIFVTGVINSIDNPHFYRASHFFDEPRIKKDYLFTFEAWSAGGGTKRGLDGCGFQTNILNIYGEENVKEIARGVPSCVLDQLPGSIIDNIWQKNTGPNFGIIRFCGNFNTIEIALNIQQNFACGFFTQLYIPFRKLEIHNIRFENLSTRANAGPEVNFSEWSKFICNLESNLCKLGINYNKRFKHTGIGDTTFLIGYTFNNNDTKCLDFIDATIKVGALFPTGRKRNINNLFDLPQGYDGFYGIPVYVDASAGIFDWLTFGGYAGAIFFFIDKTTCVRMKTACEQNGYIKLTKGMAKVHEGSLWSVGLFAKADHAWDGFSFYLGYRFDIKRRTSLNPCDNKIFVKEIVNSDQMLKGWQMHTINIIAEYDFANFECPNRPRVQIFFDVPVDGKRIFKTNMTGATLAIDYVW